MPPRPTPTWAASPGTSSASIWPRGAVSVRSISRPVFDLAALSPDGARLLLVLARGRDRVDVLEAAGGKPVAGFRPGTGGPIVWADFLANDRILTMDAEGTLALWELPEVKPITIAEKIGQGVPVLSPGRATLAVFGGGLARFLDPTTAQVQGLTPLPSGDGSGVSAAAFRPDGAELAAVSGGTLVRVNLAQKGEVVQEIPLPLTRKCTRLVYVGEGHLMLDDHWLFDIEHQRIIWVYRNGMASPTSPDGAYWTITSPQLLGTGILRAIETPDKEIRLLEPVAFAAGSKGLLHRGGTVAIQVDGGPPRQADEFKKKLIDGLAQRLTLMGMTVADQAPVKLVVKLSERALPGATIELHLTKLGGGKAETEKRSIPARVVDWEIALVDPTGPPIVLASHKGSLGMFGFIQIPPGETDYEGIVRLRHFEGARDQQISRVDLPDFVGAATRRRSADPRAGDDRPGPSPDELRLASAHVFHAGVATRAVIEAVPRTPARPLRPRAPRSRLPPFRRSSRRAGGSLPDERTCFGPKWRNGRRAGLKIRSGSPQVWVQVPPSALRTCGDSRGCVTKVVGNNLVTGFP